MAKKFDLGDALADVLTVSNSDTETLEYIDIALIDGDERNFYAVDGIEELAANIQLVGLQQPLRVRVNPDMPGRYLVVSGHRRRAALWTLYEEQPEKWGKVPCIVEHDAVSPAMQELRLIYANADTRRMSSADISKQAERVEMLLYQLKAEGIEFPGRMRDHVAEACKVSATKLATLKVIRENLIPKLKKYWENGKMPESVAYVCAKYSPEIQEQMIEFSKKFQYYTTPDKWHEYTVKDWLLILEREAKLKCRNGAPGGMCDNTAKRLDHIASDRGHWDDACKRNGGCCSDCEYLATCKAACPHLAEEIKRAKAKRKKDQAEAVAKQEAHNRPHVEPRIALWKRFGEARAAADLDWPQYMKKAEIYGFSRLKHVDVYEKGEKITINVDLPYCGGNGYPLYYIQYLCRAADALGVSLDYLLCRTDDPDGSLAPAENQTPSAAAPSTAPVSSPQFYTEGHPPRPGMYYCRVANAVESWCLILCWDMYQDGWAFDDGSPVGLRVLSWYPLPDDPEEVQ